MHIKWPKCRGLAACDSPDALLPSCIPNLQLDPLVVYHNLLDLEVNSAEEKQCQNVSTSPAFGGAVYPNAECSVNDNDYPIVVMKLEVKESSENLKSKQLFPTPAGLVDLSEFEESDAQFAFAMGGSPYPSQ